MAGISNPPFNCVQDTNSKTSHKQTCVFCQKTFNGVQDKNIKISVIKRNVRKQRRSQGRAGQTH